MNIQVVVLLLGVALSFPQVTPATEGPCEAEEIGLRNFDGRSVRAFLQTFPDEPGCLPRVFEIEDRLRRPIRAFVGDPALGELAVNLLALIGVPDDLQFIVRRLSPTLAKSSDNRWAYGVVCALVEPHSEAEWQFLRSAALNQYDDWWVDAGAIQTLQLIASRRSRRILEEVLLRNAERKALVAKALRYIDSNPPPLVDRNVERLATRIAEIVKVGQWEGNSAPTYNRTGDKATVASVFRAGSDRLTYTPTFHRSKAVWQYRGTRQTLQEATAPLPPPPPQK